MSNLIVSFEVEPNECTPGEILQLLHCALDYGFDFNVSKMIITDLNGAGKAVLLDE